MRRSVFSILILILMIFLTVTICFAADESADEEKGQGGLAESIKYLSAALSVGLCAIATGIAQSRIGAAGMGSIVEKPETTGTVIIMLAIPETMVILGFVVAAIIIIL